MRLLIARFRNAWHRRALYLKAASFAAVGVVNTVIDFTVFWAAATVLLWPLVPANVLAWAVAVTCSYVMNCHITFGPETGRILRWGDYLAFAATGVAGMAASTAALFALAYVMPLLAAKLASILVSFVVNFALSNLVVFRPRPPAGG
jgi:putative flippase GtrA